MRPLKLKIRGLNSFIEEQVIDFEKLTSKGLFGIFGPTGSGKSTILDGITLALYGEVARKSTNFINTNVDTMGVSFEFQMSSSQIKRYRAEREFKREKNGSIRTKSARIVDSTGEEDVVLEEQVRQVTNKCQEIVGLKLDDFTRTVVLPQGKFSEFLKLQGKERREMLERLFNLEQYGDELSQKLYGQIGKYRHEESEINGQLKSYEEVSEDIIKKNEREISEIKEQDRALKEEKEKIEERYSRSKELWELQIELNKAMEQMDELEKQRIEMDSWKDRVQLGEKALRILPYVESYEHNAETLNRERKTLGEIKESLNEIEENRSTILKEYGEAQKAREEELPILQERQYQFQDALAIEDALKHMNREKEKVNQSVKSIEVDLHENREKIAKQKTQVGGLSEKIAQEDKSLEEVNISHEYAQQVRSAFSLMEKIEGLQETCSKQEKANNALIEKLTKTRSEQAELDKSIEEKEKSLANLQQRLDEMMASSSRGEEDLLTASQRLNYVKEKWDRYKEVSSAMQVKEEAKREAESELSRLKLQQKEAEESLCQLEEKQSLQRKESMVYTLRKNLEEGEPCPVCGSTEHHVQDTAYDIGDFEKLEAKIGEEIEGLSTLDRQIASMEGKLESEEKSIEQSKAELARLGTDFLDTSVEDMEAKFKNLQKNFEQYKQEKNEVEKALSLAKEEKSKMDIRQSASAERIDNDARRQVEIEGELKERRKEREQSVLTLDAQLNELQIRDIKEAMRELTEKEGKRESLQKSIKELRNLLAEKQSEEQILLKKETDLNALYIQKCEDLRGKEESASEKEKSLISKVGHIDNIAEELNRISERINQITKTFSKCQEEKDKSDMDFNTFREKLRLSVTRVDSLKEDLEREEKKLAIKLSEENFVTREQVKDSSLSLDEINGLKKKIEEYNSQVNQLSGAINRILHKTNGKTISHEDWIAVQSEREDISKRAKEVESKLLTMVNDVNKLRIRREEKKEIERNKKRVDERLGYLGDLESLFKGKAFVEYVATYQLQYVSKEASVKLKEITRGNYGMEVDESGKFILRDFKNGGAVRDASTLSGGETFLVSLALALSLSAQLQLKGTAPLEFFFLDEGFGTLDEETLEVVMDTLERIHHEKLSIGIISHVESIKNRVPVKLIVEPATSGLGGSKVRIEYS